MASNYYPFATAAIVQTYKPLEIGIQWTLDSAFRDIGPFQFTVEVSETPTFAELMYELPAADNFYAIDDKKVRQNSIIDVYYRVRLNTGSNKVYYSPALSWWANRANAHQRHIAAEICRREFVRYRYTGQKGWLLKRRNYGIQDPELLDPISGVPLTDNSADLGTGYLKGYYPPLPVTYSREAVENSAQLSHEGFGTTTQDSQRHRYVGFPGIEPYDVLVTEDNQRYRYVKVNGTYMPGTDILLIQSCEGILLPLTDPIYNIPIN